MSRDLEFPLEADEFGIRLSSTSAEVEQRVESEELQGGEGPTWVGERGDVGEAFMASSRSG